MNIERSVQYVEQIRYFAGDSLVVIDLLVEILHIRREPLQLLAPAQCLMVGYRKRCATVFKEPCNLLFKGPEPFIVAVTRVYV